MKCHAINHRPLDDILAPKPVQPYSKHRHGLFGHGFVKEHMIIDPNWSPGAVTEQFKGMTSLLEKRLAVKKLEANALKKRFMRENRCLRRHCRDGRTKLSMILRGDNMKKVRNFLINHKDMQRLYQKMPMDMILDNINQRTFVIRKERDRLQFRLGRLKEIYEKKLIESAALENRVKYQGEYYLEEELKSFDYRKKIENSKIRLKAIKTVNSAYKKMIQILQHDEIFYEPILSSIMKDSEDQANFIMNILYLGTPAIAKFKELSDEYRLLEEKSRKNSQNKLAFLNNYKKDVQNRRMSMLHQKPVKEETFQQALVVRYVRETDSMMELKHQLEFVERVVKQVKATTLCSRALEIHPRIKTQVDNNERLCKMIEHDILGHVLLNIKLKRAEVLEGVLVNNLTEEETERLKHITVLENQIQKADEAEAETFAYLTKQGNIYVLLRFFLWNILEILRHVDRPGRLTKVAYPNSYLRLPLLKFEMLTMRACPPDLFEENVDAIMHLVKRKLHKLMKVFDRKATSKMLREYAEEYHLSFVDTLQMDEASGSTADQDAEDENDLLENKVYQNIPSRKQIKMMSAKLVEEMSRKDE